MDIKKQLLALTFLLMTITVFSQEEKKENSFSWDKVRYGGRINLQLSSSVTSVILSPAAVYQFNPQFAAGATVSFGYTDFKHTNTYLYNYGASILGIYTPIQQLQLSAELEQVFVDQTTNLGDLKIKDNYNYQALFLGAGFRMKNVVVGMRYDVLYNEDNNLYSSPYSPFVQVFF